MGGGTPFGAKETSIFTFKIRQKVSILMGKNMSQNLLLELMKSGKNQIRFSDYKNYLENRIETEIDKQICH